MGVYEIDDVRIGEAYIGILDRKGNKEIALFDSEDNIIVCDDIGSREEVHQKIWELLKTYMAIIMMQNGLNDYEYK